ncbi:MAG: hypothetical protein Q7R52_01460 [archaeon]|nr:hypothetical protein [archaeon]
MPINFSDFKKGEVILLIVSAQKYLSVSMDVLKHYCNTEKNLCVYVSVNKPYTTLMNLIKKEKINSDKLFVIDAITPTSSQSKGAENVIFTGSPRGLTDISISASSAIKNLPKGDRMLFFDSLSTLLIYNDVGSVTKFAHFLINKMKEWNITGVIISLEKETDAKLSSQLSQFVDKVVEIK